MCRILASAIGRSPNNCSSFTTINCTETYLKLYSHYPENAAISHSFYFFQVKFPFGDIFVHLARRFLSPLQWAMHWSHPPFLYWQSTFTNGVALNTRVVNHNFRNALTLHYNFSGYFTSSSNLFYETVNSLFFHTFSSGVQASAVWVHIARNAMRT